MTDIEQIFFEGQCKREQSQACLNSAESSLSSIFYQLIRVSIGTQETLSRPPSGEEWEELFEMAVKQSLIGVCFVAVQHLTGVEDTINHTPYTIHLQETLYLNWLGMAANIQQRNEVINNQCVELQKRLSADGMRSCILKGQGVGALYRVYENENCCPDGSMDSTGSPTINLQGLRQPGDIDIFVAGGMNTAFEYCQQKYGNFEWDYINAHIPVFDDTEVELHWRVHSHSNLFKNKLLQRWLKEHELSILQGNEADLGCGKVVVPTPEFNAFYILLHCYHHMFESGLGLRQLMDYYFVLREYSKIPQTGSIAKVFEQFGLERFASAVMWIMKYVFGMEDKYLLCEPNEEEGRFILNEVMQNGNFGHHDERKIKVKSKLAQPFVTRIQHNWHLATHYPSEFFWAPVWLVYHFFWKRTRNQK